MQIIFHCCTLNIYNCRCKRERGSSTPLTAASFCARGALRGAWYAPSTKLYAPTSQICTQPCPLYASQMHLSSTTSETERSASWLAAPTRPLQRRPPASCSLSLPRDEDCSGRQREARTVGEGSEGSSTRGGGQRGNDRGFWRHQRQWMECKTRFSLKI